MLYVANSVGRDVELLSDSIARQRRCSNHLNLSPRELVVRVILAALLLAEYHFFDVSS